MTAVDTAAARFSDQELQLAQQLRDKGLSWEPTCGHYVLDLSDLIECDSPFQGRVFYILDLKHFLRRAGTLDNLRASMCWLPTWEQARWILSELGLSDRQVAEHLQATQAVERGDERFELYRLIDQRLDAGSTA